MSLTLKETTQEIIKIKGSSLQKLVLIEVHYDRPIKLKLVERLQELELWET